MRGTGTVPFSPPQPTQQNYVVEDFSDVNTVDSRLAEFEENTQQFREEPVKPKVDLEAQRKLEALIFMGRYTKTIELAGHKFELVTLTHRETNEIVAQIVKAGDTANQFVVRTLTLANAVKSIDGIGLDTFDVGQFATALERRAAVIDQMQLTLVEHLYAAYDAMTKESEEAIYGEKVKNS